MLLECNAKVQLEKAKKMNSAGKVKIAKVVRESVQRVLARR